VSRRMVTRDGPGSWSAEARAPSAGVSAAGSSPLAPGGHPPTRATSVRLWIGVPHTIRVSNAIHRRGYRDLAQPMTLNGASGLTGDRLSSMQRNRLRATHPTRL